MCVSSGPEAQVVLWDPELLMILTWPTRDVHQGPPPCNLLDFNLWAERSRAHYTYSQNSLPWLGYLCMATLPESLHSLLQDVFTLVQWQRLFNRITSLKPGCSYRQRFHTTGTGGRCKDITFIQNRKAINTLINFSFSQVDKVIQVLRSLIQ